MQLLAEFWKKHIYKAAGTRGTDISALILRLVFGLSMLYGHGIAKFNGFSKMSAGFPDPLGIGSPLSLALTVGAEFFCAIAVTIGLATRYTVIPLLIAMLVAALVFHAADPFAKKELAIVYLGAYAAIGLLGSGRYSVDAWLAGRK